MQDKLFTIVAAAKYKGVSYNTIAYALSIGSLKAAENVVGAVLIPQSELDRYVPQRKYQKFINKQNHKELEEYVD